jgi:hypothetical protein
MGKGKFIIAVILLLLMGFLALYYYYPRKVSFELAKEINKPTDDFDNSQFMGYHYVKDADELVYLWVDFYGYLSSWQKEKKGYDAIFVNNLVKKLDFENYDYLITYQKQLKGLRHSPYLTYREDGLKYEKKIPLIPIWESESTNKIYLYRIKSNNKYRSPGP